MIRAADLLVAALAATSLAAATSGQTIVPYLLEGDEAPDTSFPPDLWENFDQPVISESGIILAIGDTNAPSDVDDVVYSGMTLVGLQGNPDPSFLGSFSVFQEPTTNQEINIAGDVVFIASLSGGAPTTSNEGVYKYDVLSGMLSTIVLEGDPAPGLPGHIIADMEFAGISNDGTIGYMATLDTSSGPEVIYRNNVPLYQAGQAITGLPLSWNGNFAEVAWNGAGDVIFEGNGGILYLNRGGVEQVLLTDGVPVPVRGGGTDFVSLVLQTALAENGLWAMRGNLQNAPSSADAFIMTETGQIQQGEPIAELPGAVTGNFNGLDFNSHGQVLYIADIVGAADPNTDEGLFMDDQLLAYIGQQVPGQAPGTVFTDIEFEDISINDAGQIVFHAYYNDISTLPLRGSVDGIFMIELPAACVCETDGDANQVNVFDLLAYLDLWFVNADGADIDGTAGVDVFDLLFFLDCWFPASAGNPCA